VPALDPAAVTEAEHLLAVEPARVLEVDVLNGGGIAHLGHAETAFELALLAGRPLAVDQEAQPLVEAQARALGRGELLLKGLGHSREFHGVHLLEGLLGQHSFSSSAA